MSDPEMFPRGQWVPQGGGRVARSGLAYDIRYKKICLPSKYPAFKNVIPKKLVYLTAENRISY